MQTPTSIHALVPAAGRGTRLRPLTDAVPKPLVEVAGRPLIEHVLDALVPAGPDAIAIVIGHRGEQIRAHVGDSYEGVPVEYVRQPEPRGLADAVARAEPVVDGQVLVCNGDNVFAGDLAPLADAHASDAGARRPAAGNPDADASPPAATLLVEETTPDVAATTGVVVTDDEGAVERVVEKPAEPPSTLVTTGAYAFSPAIFEACAAIEPADTGEYELADAITWLLERGHRVRTRRYEGERVNVNEPADVERAAQLVTES